MITYDKNVHHSSKRKLKLLNIQISLMGAVVLFFVDVVLFVVINLPVVGMVGAGVVGTGVVGPAVVVSEKR